MNSGAKLKIHTAATYVFALVSGLTLAGISPAQVVRVRPSPQSGPLGIQPHLVLAGSITVSASPALVNFNLSPGSTSNASSNITITTSWAGVTGASVSMNLYGYFSSNTAALQDNAPTPDLIPSSDVFGEVSGPSAVPTSFTPFTQTTPFGSAASGLNLVSNGSILTLGATWSITNSLSLEINLGSLPQLPAGTYNGTLTLQAQLL